MRRPAALLATSLLALGGASGCGGDDGLAQARAALDRVCGDAGIGTNVTSPEIDDLDDAKPHAACVIDGDETSAWSTASDPFDALVNSGDGWQSGDGSSVEVALRRIDGGRWLFVYLHRADEEQDAGVLDPLDADGFKVFPN